MLGGVKSYRSSLDEPTALAAFQRNRFLAIVGGIVISVSHRYYQSI